MSGNRTNPFNRPTATGTNNARPNRNVSPAARPAVTQGESVRATEIYTLFTKIGSQPQDGTPLLYNGDRPWANITLTLTTAGPVDVGVRADLFPVGSGKGIPLVTGVPVTFPIAKGTRLYYAANAISRINVVIAPDPYLEQMAGCLQVIASK